MTRNTQLSTRKQDPKMTVDFPVNQHCETRTGQRQPRCARISTNLLLVCLLCSVVVVPRTEEMSS